MKTLLWLLLGASATSLSAQDAPHALARAESWYQHLSGLRAVFTQEIVNPMLGGPETSRGTLFLSPPDRFAMRFEDPEGDRLVADGNWLWIYTPSTVPGQVIKQPVPEMGAISPNLFAQFVLRPLERYRSTWLGKAVVDGMTVERVKLVPRLGDLPFTEAIVGIGPAGQMKTLWFRESTGQTRQFVFYRITELTRVPERELTFHAPPGVRVVTP